MVKRDPRNRTTGSWLIYSIGSAPAELVGIVNAPDEQTAMRKAIKEHKITRREQVRLVAQRRK